MFGMFNVIDQLTEGKVWLADTVLALPYSICYLKMKKNYEEAQYQKRLRKILSRNK